MADFFAVRKGEKMLSYLKKHEAPPPTEGALYKTVEIEGKRFSLYYGYYEECDRENPFCDPIPIYPDFLKDPIYTNEGYPFATDMQDACEHYGGHSPEEGCYSCRHYKKCEEFFGICLSPERRRRE
jgi:hypothetical protein